MKNNAHKIYFDHAATTPIDPRVLKAMMPYMTEKYGNASSAHSFGREAMSAINKSRKILADFFNCAMDEIILTSGATESNNLAIQGVINSCKTTPNPSSVRRGKDETTHGHSHSADAQGKLLLRRGKFTTVETQNFASLQRVNPHIITSQIEHPSVLEIYKEMERMGIEVSYVGVNKEGVVSVDDIKNAIKDNTVLISIMYVNHETGVIQPIREIGKMIEKVNKQVAKTRQYLVSTTKRNILFHTDATQAVNYCECDIKYLHVDMLSMSGHKVYGPKGVGCLIAKKGTLSPIFYGGHQENGLRSGTYNTPGIVGLGKAVEVIAQERRNIKLEKGKYLINSKSDIKIKKLRDKILKEIMKKIPDTTINGSIEYRIPSNLNLSFKNIEGESLMIMLDMKGVALSTGSACSSGKTESSYVLKAMGAADRMAEGSIRITLGKDNTMDEVKYFIKELIDAVYKLRKFAGNN